METKDGQSLLVWRLSALLSRVGGFWLRRSYFQQIVLVLLLLPTKNAFDIELRNIQEAYLPGVQEFPQAAGYFSASFGQVIIAHGLGLTTTTQWIVVHVVLIAVALGVAFYLISRADPERRSFMILVLASATATSSLFVSIGKYDVVTFLGAVGLALARTLPGALVGALVMASGNPEQAIVATAALCVLSVSSEFRDLRSRAVGGLLLAGLLWVLVQIWFQATNMSGGRLQLLPEYLAESISRVISYPGSAFWSWLNAGWVFLVLFALMAGRRQWIWIVISLLVVPATATVITADGGRVFGSIVLPAYLVTGLWFGRRVFRDMQNQRALTGATVSLVVLLPITVTGPGWFFDQTFGLLGRFF